ncbi:MAG: UvrD-helicase domain-containing protein [Planctomycetaceae bacterium]
MDLLEGLTPSQQEAVEHCDGPLLVLAGPGSGKTRVVTRRIARLVERGIPPQQIVAITFTNKASEEMQFRVEGLLPNAKVRVSTFHKFCARLLRRYGEMAGLKSNYTILDTGDQKTLIRRVMQDLDFDTQHFSPAKVLWQISKVKNDLISAEAYREQLEGSYADHWEAAIGRIYPAYQKALIEANGVDFDDLLMHIAILLRENEEVRRNLGRQYRYIMVDEYQDTNSAQYQIVAALAAGHHNLCVTGDPDQSIYGWRGAKIENILRFERDFPEAKTIRLEQNFRSTGAILRSADSLIANNRRRKEKSLLTDKGDGHAVRLFQFDSAFDEADSIAREIRDLVERRKRKWDDVAIFYRVNALSRVLELAMMRERVPFQVASGVAFYDRTEIKDLLAYLRLVFNPADHTAFLRVVNKPLRGLGETSQNRLARWAGQQGVTLLEAASRSSEVPKLSKRAVVQFKRFAELIQRCTYADSGSVGDLLEKIISVTAYTAAWKNSPVDTDQDRMLNVGELVNAARSYDKALGEEATLEGFLEQTSLVNETDSFDPSQGAVKLMTLHAAKGLEFPVVYLVGLEQGMLPHSRSIEGDSSADELEEERRLLFVGMTRAEESLTLTYARRRMVRGEDRITIPSQFLSELEAERMQPERLLPFEQEWNKPRSEGASGTSSKVGVGLPGDLMSRLKTGADLVNGTNSTVALPQGFAVGSQVRHPRYGVGLVTGVSGLGPKKTITVRFQDADADQSFLAAKSPLQPLGGR